MNAPVTPRFQIERPWRRVTEQRRSAALPMRAIIASLSICLAGCQYDPHTASYTKTEPKPEDLIGVYVPDHATTNLIAREGHYQKLPISITLSAGGSLAITNIPDWWGTDFGRPGGGFDAGRGTWRVLQHQEWWAVSADFESTAQFASRQHRAESLSTSFMLVGERPPYKIHLTVGDPDEGRAMQFERVASPSR